MRLSSFKLIMLDGLSLQYNSVEPVREETNILGVFFRPGPTQTDLYSPRIWLDASKFVKKGGFCYP